MAVRVRRDRKMPSEMETITDQFNRMMGQMNKTGGRSEDGIREAKRRRNHSAGGADQSPLLYNTLDTINWMAINADQYEISSAIGALARILRYGI